MYQQIVQKLLLDNKFPPIPLMWMKPQNIVMDPVTTMEK